MAGGAPQAGEGIERELEGNRIILGRADAGGIIGEVGPGKLVIGKPLGDLEPALHASSRIGFGECPQVPGAAVGRIGGERPRCEVAHHIRASSSKPVGVGEPHKSAGMAWLPVDDDLHQRTEDLRNAGVCIGGGEQLLGGRFAREGRERLEQLRKVAVLPIFVDDGRELRQRPAA